MVHYSKAKLLSSLCGYLLLSLIIITILVIYFDKHSGPPSLLERWFEILLLFGPITLSFLVVCWFGFLSVFKGYKIPLSSGWLIPSSIIAFYALVMLLNAIFSDWFTVH